MIETIVVVFRYLFALVGLFASVEPSMSCSALTVALIALATLTLALLATALHAASRGSTPHPTRRIELTAPLAQSDPDAAGHVRRRGPGQVTAAA